MLALSNGRAKFQCCISTETVDVYGKHEKLTKLERQSSSSFFPKKFFSGPEVFKNVRNFEIKRGERGSFDSFTVFRPLKIKNFERQFFPKIFSNFFQKFF